MFMRAASTLAAISGGVGVGTEWRKRLGGGERRGARMSKGICTRVVHICTNIVDKYKSRSYTKKEEEQEEEKEAQPAQST